MSRTKSHLGKATSKEQANRTFQSQKVIQDGSVLTMQSLPLSLPTPILLTEY